MPASSSRPIVAVAGRPTPWGDLAGIGTTAREAGFFAIDLDLTRTLLPPRWGDDEVGSGWGTLRLRSCWLPAMLGGPFARQRAATLLRFLRRGRDQAGLRTIVLPRSASGRGVPMAATVRELASGNAGTSLRLAVGVDAAMLAASRSQMSALQSIRRMAEEWDLDIALDLTVPTSSAWEAEAAVLRLLPRLRIVRLPCQIEHVPDASARVVDRTLAMLADQGYGGTFSLLPPRPLTLRRQQARQAESVQRMQRAIATRYERVAHDLALDPGLRRLPGSSEPR